MSTVVPAETADKAMRSGKGKAPSGRPSSEILLRSIPEPLNLNPLAQRMPTFFLPTDWPFALENPPTPLRSWNGPSQVFSGGRFIRLVLYGRISVDDVHSIWIDHQSTYGDIVKELATIDATCTFTVLEPIWGPTPRWAESNPKSPIGSTSHVLYAVINDDRRYIVGVVRASLSDYPVAIFESSTDPSRTITQAIIASRPQLEGQIKSITGLLEGQSGKHADLLMDQDFKSVVVINTLDDPPKIFVSELPTGSIPPLLRVPFAYCENLMKQAYDLEVFALQIIHILRAILHIIISLAKKTEAAFKDDPSDIEVALLAQDEVSEWLRATPMLSRNLQEVEELMGSVTTADPGTMQKEIEKVFEAVCGEYPGAVDVRHSHRHFTKLSLIDHEEDGVPIRGSGTDETEVTHTKGAPLILDPYQRKPLNVTLSGLRTKRAGLGALALDSSTSSPSTPTGHHISPGWGDPPPYSLLPPIIASAGGTNYDVDNKGKRVTDRRGGPASTLETATYRTPSKLSTGYSATNMIPQPPLLIPGPSGSPHAMQPNINTREDAVVGISQYQCSYCGRGFDRPGRFEAHLNTHGVVRPRLSSPILTSTSSSMGFTSTEALESHPRDKLDAWRNDLKTLADRSGITFKTEEYQNQLGTWWSFYYVTNPDGSKGICLGSHSGKTKAIAKEHAAKESYGNLMMMNTWTENGAKTSTSATCSINTDLGNV